MSADVLAVALFEAYSRNGGNPPDAHFDRNAAEQWMQQALVEVGVAELIEAAEVFGNLPGVPGTAGSEDEDATYRFFAALARVAGDQA